MWIFQPADLPLVGGYVLVLVFFEGLLSADNALVLALMVRHLPRIDQRRVLRYGIWGAIGFRVIAVLLATQLRKYWIFKVIGGLYLLYLAISHFVSQRRSATAEGADRSAKPQGWWQGFWGTVTSITLADIAFSIDSILAAVTMAEDFPARFGDSGKTFILLTGGILGIITMRFAVRLFVSLLERFSGLAEGAYYLVAWIGLKLLISGFHTGDYLPFKIEEWLFWSGMALIAVVSLLAKPRRKKPEEEDAGQALDLIESDDEHGSADGRSSDDKGPQDGRSSDDQVHQDGGARGSS
jgi:YkoY family integral membrane protein